MSKAENKKPDEKLKEFSCYFVGEIFIKAKDENEARDKAWKEFLRRYEDIIDLEEVVEIDVKSKE